MLRYTILILLPLVSGCGLFGEKGQDYQASRVSVHDRDRAECEMKALEVIPEGENAEARIQRYTQLCMQSRGYPASGGTEVKVRIRE